MEQTPANQPPAVDPLVASMDAPPKRGGGLIVPILIIILIAVLAGAVTWWYVNYQANKQKQADEATINELTQKVSDLQKNLDELKAAETSNAATQTANWNTYTATNGSSSLSFKLPPDWKTLNQSGSVQFYSPNVSNTSVAFPQKDGEVAGQALVAPSKLGRGTVGPQKSNASFAVNNVSFTKTIFEGTNEAGGQLLQTNQFTLEKGSFYDFFYTLFPNDKTNKEIMDQVVKTITVK